MNKDKVDDELLEGFNYQAKMNVFLFKCLATSKGQEKCVQLAQLQGFKSCSRNILRNLLLSSGIVYNSDQAVYVNLEGSSITSKSNSYLFEESYWVKKLGEDCNQKTLIDNFKPLENESLIIELLKEISKTTNQLLLKNDVKQDSVKTNDFKSLLIKGWNERQLLAFSSDGGIKDLNYKAINKAASFRIPYYIVEEFEDFCSRNNLKQGVFLSMVIVFSIKAYKESD